MIMKISVAVQNMFVHVGSLGFGLCVPAYIYSNLCCLTLLQCFYLHSCCFPLLQSSSASRDSLWTVLPSWCGALSVSDIALLCEEKKVKLCLHQLLACYQSAFFCYLVQISRFYFDVKSSWTHPLKRSVLSQSLSFRVLH